VIRAASAAVIGALAGAAWLALFYIAGGGPRADFDINPPRLVSGFHGAERDRSSGLTFAWTGAEAGIRLPGLDRRVEWTLTVRARGARAPGENPLVAFFVDGVLVHTQTAAPDFEHVRVQIPVRPERRGLTIVMRMSSTFVPGPTDPRQLGIVVDALDLKPNGLVLPPANILATAMAGGAALAATIALIGVTAGSAIGAAVLLSAGQGAALAYGFAPFTTFPAIALRSTLAISVILGVGIWLLRRRASPLRNTARFAIAFSAGACVLELLVLLHPHMPVGDALFQAHRFHEVLRGNLYFTSIAPGGYAFPYAPGLYVMAAPFAGLVGREMGDAALLRVVTTVADVIAGLLLYFITARAWHDRLAAAFAVAIYHLMPLGFRIVTVGNLTNAFAESLAVGALVLIAAPAVRAPTAGATLLLAVVLTAAFLSHTSTFAILTVCALCTAMLFAWTGGPALRRPAVAVALAAAVGVVVAVVVYYMHFVEVYQTELARIGGETRTGTPDAGGRGVLARAAAVPRYLHIYLGLPALALALCGIVDRWRRAARDRLTLAVAAWGLTCTAFLILGVLTPLDMRYYLAAVPPIALLAALGASWGWRERGAARLSAAALLGWILWTGVETWWSTLS
jgi:hypothetical protein